MKIFEVANCRGYKPIETDLKKVLNILASLRMELNPCKAKSVIDKFAGEMGYLLVKQNPKITIYK